MTIHEIGTYHAYYQRSEFGNVSREELAEIATAGLNALAEYVGITVADTATVSAMNTGRFPHAVIEALIAKFPSEGDMPDRRVAMAVDLARAISKGTDGQWAYNEFEARGGAKVAYDVKAIVTGRCHVYGWSTVRAGVA